MGAGGGAGGRCCKCLSDVGLDGMVVVAEKNHTQYKQMA